MNAEQFERWRDFALRMARTCYRTHRRPTGKWVEAVVKDFFYRIDDDFADIVDWDSAPAYISDSMSEFLYQYEPVTPRCRSCESGVIYRPERCDAHRYRVVGRIPRDDGRFYDPGCDCPNGHHDYYKAEQCPKWLKKRRALCRCDEVEQAFGEQWDQQWGGPVHCCVRAGLDLVSAPSAGVMGFTAGDVRRMYPEGVPDWVFPPNERLEVQHFTGVIPGVGLIPGKREINGTFDELPDEAQVWL